MMTPCWKSCAVHFAASLVNYWCGIRKGRRGFLGCVALGRQERTAANFAPPFIPNPACHCFRGATGPLSICCRVPAVSWSGVSVVLMNDACALGHSFA